MGDCKKGAHCNFGHFFTERQDISRMSVWSIPQRLGSTSAEEWGILVAKFIYHQDFFKLVTASRNGAVCTWNHENGLNEHVFSVEGIVNSLAYADGHLLCGVQLFEQEKRRGQLVIINLASKEIQRYDGHEDAITQVILIKEFVLTAGYDGQIHVWQMVEDKFKIVSSLPLYDEESKLQVPATKEYSALIYLNQLVIAGTSMGHMVVWNLDFEKGLLQLVRVFEAHNDGITRLKLIHGSLVSIGQDGHLKIWTEQLELHFDHKFEAPLTDIVLAKDSQGSDVLLISTLYGHIEAFNTNNQSVRPGVVKLYDEMKVMCMTVIADAYESQSGQEEDKHLSDEVARVFVSGDHVGNVNVFKFGSEQDPFLTSDDKFAS